MKVQTNYCINNNETLLLSYWDDQGKIKMYYGMPRVKKQLSGKWFIHTSINSSLFSQNKGKTNSHNNVY